ncbi:unnamed protein product, partial [Rotaria sordida]
MMNIVVGDCICNINTYWRCEHLTGCHGRVIQRGDDEPPLPSSHNHDLDKKRFKSDLKHPVREGQSPFQQIYRAELIKRYTTHTDDLFALPQYHQIENPLYRTKYKNFPPLSRSINEIPLE